MIIESTVRPPERLKIGSELKRIARESRGMDEIAFPRLSSRIRGVNFE